MTLAFTCNGYYKKTHEEVTYTLEIEVEGDYPEYFKKLLQKGELTYSHDNNTIVIALRELSWFKNIIFRYVTAINEKHAYSYLVMLEWVSEDDSGLEHYIFKDYKVAKEKYKQLIKDETDSDITWVGSKVLDENGNINKGYIIESGKETDNEPNLFWRAIDLKANNRFSTVTLTKVETL